MRERDEVVGTMGGAWLGGWWGVAGSSCLRLRRGALIVGFPNFSCLRLRLGALIVGFPNFYRLRLR